MSCASLSVRRSQPVLATLVAGLLFAGSAAVADNDLYIATSAGQLVRYEPDLSARRILIDPPYLLDDRIALAPASGRLFWAVPASGRVHRASADGANVETIICHDFIQPDVVAVDETSNVLFVYDRAQQTIFRADVDGNDLAAIIEGVADLDYMDVHAADDALLWTHRDAKSNLWRIRSAEYDGDNAVTIVDGLSRISGFDVEDVAGFVYWADADALRRADIDGANEQVLHAPGSPNRLSAVAAAPDDDRVYFVEQTSDQQFAMHHVPLAGGSPTFHGLATFPIPHIAIDAGSDNLYWTDIGGIVRHDGGSQATHIASAATPLSTFAIDHAGSRVFSASTSGTGNIWKVDLTTGDSQIIHTHLATSIRVVAYDPVNDRVLWLDAFNDVYRCDTSGGNVQLLVNIASGWLRDLFVDTVTEKFYVADATPDQVVQYDLDGANPSVIIDMGGSLTSFAIDHDTNTVYFANNSGGTTHLQKAPVGGTVPLVVLQEEGSFERLRLNTSDGKLYWNTTSPRALRRSNLDGSNIETLNIDIGGAVAYSFALGPRTPATLHGDINGDGAITVFDVISALSAFGPCPCGQPCPQDLNGDGQITVGDILAVLTAFGTTA